jgi:hypothetical protein
MVFQKYFSRIASAETGGTCLPNFIIATFVVVYGIH